MAPETTPRSKPHQSIRVVVRQSFTCVITKEKTAQRRDKRQVVHKAIISVIRALTSFPSHFFSTLVEIMSRGAF